MKEHKSLVESLGDEFFNEIKRKKSEIKRKEMNSSLTDILLMTARIDKALYSMIAKRTIKASNLADEQGGVAITLMKRAKLCFALGHISQDLYAVIKELSKIRNKCAHATDTFDPFTDKDLVNKINNIHNKLHQKYTLPNEAQIKEKFMRILILIEITLSQEAANIKKPPEQNREKIFHNNQ